MYEYKATMVHVVDGDTIDFDVDLGVETHRLLRVRLYGVDTPERGQAGWAEATDFVKSWFAKHGNVIQLETIKDKTEKYGRYLAMVYAPDAPISESLNRLLVSNGLARVYLP